MQFLHHEQASNNFLLLFLQDISIRQVLFTRSKGTKQPNHCYVQKSMSLRYHEA